MRFFESFRIRTGQTAVFLAAVLWLVGEGVGASPVHAYEVQPVEHPGSITGKAVFRGPVPPPRSFGLIVYPDIELCERISDGKGHRLLYDFTVSREGGFKDVVVVVEGVEGGLPFSFEGPRISIKNCEFTPFMTAARDGKTVTVHNMDEVIHDIQTYGISDNKRGDRIFDRAALPKSVLTNKIKLPKGQKIVWVQCGKHSFMQTWAYAVESPYFAVTDFEGNFTISGLPPGHYRVTAWHPFMKLREQTVEVKAGSAASAQFEFGK